jgi:class 3 adenylate cyclase
VLVAFTVSLELTILLSRSMFGPLDALREATERVRRGDLRTRVPVISTDETGRLARSFNDMVVGLGERERLREAFGAYVGPNIAEKVLRDGPHLDGEELEVSILCLDIRDFTRFAERASAREVVDRLNEFYDMIVPLLVRHGGYPDKYVGDGLLGVFGAPEPIVAHADRAVAAAIEIARAVRDRYEGDLRVGIGVNSGLVIAGTIGGGGHVEFTVIGDPVNTAARVEQVTRQTGDAVLVTEATQRRLCLDHGGFDARPAAPLKGKRERVELWAPRALAETGLTAELATQAGEAGERP